MAQTTEHPSKSVRPHLRGQPERVLEPIPREDLLRRTWRRFHLAHGARPIASALIVGGATLAIASQLGAPELAIGAMAAYVTYRMVRYGIDLKQALTETVEIEKTAEEIA